MNQMLAVLWTKAVENKGLLLRVGGAIAGALIGAAITNAVSNAQELSPESWEDFVDTNDLLDGDIQ
jgi:hypothetical protein